MIHENRQEEVIIDLKLTFIARFLVHKKQDEIKSIVKAGILERKDDSTIISNIMNRLNLFRPIFLQRKSNDKHIIVHII